MKDTGLYGVDAETRPVFRADRSSRPILDQTADR